MPANDHDSFKTPDPGASRGPAPGSGEGPGSAEFIFEPITAHFERPPELEKKPGCPEAITWRGRRFRIVELEREWRDYGRRGRMAHNMRPEHAAAARRRGSWGVGRHYFQVRLDAGAAAVLCYDRAPRNVRDRKGTWRLVRIDPRAVPGTPD